MAKHEIDVFKSGHTAIIIAIDEVLQNLRSYNQVKPKLREFNTIVLAHLGRQNKNFYDCLTEYYSNDREACKMQEFLLHDMKDLKIKYLIFTDKHSGEFADNNYRNFPKEFIEFSREIIERIRIEEEYLFPLLKELPAQRVASE